jgi:hypothetical protein
MTRLIIEIKDSGVLKLLETLESLNLIRVIRGEVTSNKNKLSERLRDSISPLQAKEWQKELKTMRGEWERDVYSLQSKK